VTLYLDTSSLVKLYVEEAGSDEVARLVSDATVVVTSTVAYPESRAAFARLRREGALSARAFAGVKRSFEEQWTSYLSLEATAPLCRAAGELAETYGLRGFDSVHLASYAEVVQRAAADDVSFSSFDVRLNEAVTKLNRKLKRKPRRP
jgi:predicted nucleic acid-binding protein